MPPPTPAAVEKRSAFGETAMGRRGQRAARPTAVLTVNNEAARSSGVIFLRDASFAIKAVAVIATTTMDR